MLIVITVHTPIMAAIMDMVTSIVVMAAEATGIATRPA